MSQRPCLLLITPIAPAPTGNGLAMRMWSLLTASLRVADVLLAVVPVAGSTGCPTPHRSGLTVLPELSLRAPDDGRDAVRWLNNPRWRQWLQSIAPVYPQLHSASPVHAQHILDHVADIRIDGVIAGRLWLALLGLFVAEITGCPLHIDSDDDDVAYHGERQEFMLAEAAERVARLALPRARLVTAASRIVADCINVRYAIDARCWPNCVALPGLRHGDPKSGEVLFLANFTYPPNVEGAHWLVNEVLPLLPPRYRIVVTGAHSEGIAELVGPRVVVTGPVGDVNASYGRAEVVAVPLLTGSGSRIKMLEAFAHRRPVVATLKGAEGIEARHGVHFLAATSAHEFATALQSASTRPAAPLRVAEAFDLVRRHHSDEVVARAGAELISGSLLLAAATDSPS